MNKTILWLIISISLISSVSASLTDNLIFYHTFDESDNSGTTLTDIHNNFDGTCSNMASNCNEGASLILTGNSTDFDGTNDYVSLPTGSGVLADNEGSLSCWINLDTTTNGILMAGGVATAASPYIFLQLSAAKITWSLFGTSSIEFINNLNTSQTHHIVLTSDGTNTLFYLDNIQDTGTVLSGSNGDWFADMGGLNTLAYGILDRNTDFDPINGRFDECAYWDRAITQSEVNSLWNSGNGLEYPLVEGLNLTITAKDSFINQTLNSFSASINGTTYSTTNGQINTTIPITNQEEYNLSVWATNYQTKTYYDFNASINNTIEAQLIPNTVIVEFEIRDNVTNIGINNSIVSLTDIQTGIENGFTTNEDGKANVTIETYHNYTININEFGYEQYSETWQFTSGSTKLIELNKAQLTLFFDISTEGWVHSNNYSYNFSNTNYTQNQENLSEGYITVEFNKGANETNFYQKFMYYNDQYTTITEYITIEDPDVTQTILAKSNGVVVQNARVCAHKQAIVPQRGSYLDWTITYCDYTGADGIATLILDDQTTYKITAQHDSYEPGSTIIFIEPDNTEQINIELTGTEGGTNIYTTNCQIRFTGESTECWLNLDTYKEYNSICYNTTNYQNITTLYCTYSTTTKAIYFTLGPTYNYTNIDVLLNSEIDRNFTWSWANYSPQIQIDFDQNIGNNTNQTIKELIYSEPTYTTLFFIIVGIIAMIIAFVIETHFKGYGIYGLGATLGLFATQGFYVLWIPALIPIIYKIAESRIGAKGTEEESRNK